MIHNELYVDRDNGVVVVNDSGLPMADVRAGLAASPDFGREIAALTYWIRETRSGSPESRHGTLAERDTFVMPRTPYDQMRVAYEAESDDVVSSVLESTEALAFSRMMLDCEDPYEADVWNQIADDLDLDTRMREVWREMFLTSNVYLAAWYGTKSYRVQGKSPGGKASKKVYPNLTVPTGVSILDPLRILPVGGFMFNREQLCYIADWAEKDVIDSYLLSGDASGVDPIIARLIVGRFTPDLRDRKVIGELGVDQNRLYLLDSRYVWRVTATRSQYARFATVRMKSIFPVLDLKQQLRQKDRAELIGAALRVDQRVATPSGWKAIGALSVGDEVFGSDGKPTRVTGVFPQGIRPLYRMRFADGAEVVCDASHRWAVKRPDDVSRNRPGRVLTTEQILGEGLRRRDGLARHRIPIAAPLELPEAELPLDPYLMGYLLGDGSLGSTTPQITCAEPDDEQPWRAVLPEGVEVTPYVYEDGRCPRYGLKGATWRQNAVKNGLRELGIDGLTDGDKYIPDRYLWASEAQRWALLQGLADSDGTPHQRGIMEYATVSPKLATGVVQLAQSLGGVAYVEVRHDLRGNRRACHRVFVTLHGPAAPFRLARKIAKWRPRPHPFVRAITAIEPVDAAEAVCIKVDREDGLFLTEDMVVTHNTNFIVLVRKGTDKMPAGQIEVDNLKQQMRSQPRIPVLVGDHRLSVEIVTPKTDTTLEADKYAGLDVRISGRLYGFFITPHGGRGDDSVKLARVVARGLEAKRDHQRRDIMRHLFKPTFEANPDVFTSMPELRFFPKRIALDFDPALAAYLLDLYSQGSLSRESILAEIDYDELDEARKREVEIEKFDHLFVPPVLPAGTPGVTTTPPGRAGPTDPKAGGRAGGGNRGGGGAAPGTGQGQPPRTAKTAGKAAKATTKKAQTRTAAVAEQRAAARAERKGRQRAEDDGAAAAEPRRRAVDEAESEDHEPIGDEE